MKKEKARFVAILSVYILMMPLVLGTANMALAQEITFKREEVLIVPYRRREAPTNFNPFTTSGWTNEYLRWCFEFLFYYNHLNDTIIPWLATGFEYGDNYKSITIYLRKGVTWNDGVPLTSKDVVFTVNMLKKHPELVTAAWVRSKIKDVEAIDDYTVKITLYEPNARFHWDITSLICFPWLWIVPEHVWSKVEDPVKFMNLSLIQI